MQAVRLWKIVWVAENQTGPVPPELEMGQLVGLLDNMLAMYYAMYHRAVAPKSVHFLEES